MSARTPPAENIPLLEAEEVGDDEFENGQQPSSLAAATTISTTQIPVDDPLRDYTAPPGDDDTLEAPPGYDEPAWSNSVSLEVDLEELATTTTTQFPRAMPLRPFLGPRTLSLVRQRTGYGFTLGGSAPTYVVDVEDQGSAHIAGVQKGDRILEANGSDLKQASIAQVSQIVQVATHQLVLVVAPAPPHTTAITQEPLGEQDPWQAALRMLEGDAGGGIDPTAAPDSHLGFALCSIFLCPILGPMAVWHSLQVKSAWNRNSHREAYAHAVMARKMASAACFYGLMALLLFLFVRMDRRRTEDDAGNGSGDYP
eukprot:m.64013 g.64013  ORF g.64013 m.64013 type:complete len:312 (-) comp13989_c0_seq2:945-1880(-)